MLGSFSCIPTYILVSITDTEGLGDEAADVRIRDAIGHFKSAPLLFSGELYPMPWQKVVQ